MQSKLSHSALDTFRTCPRKFKFAYIDKTFVPRKLFAFNHLGNTVHRQLKIAYQWGAEGKLYPLETMLSAYEADWGGGIKEKVIPSSEAGAVDDEIAAGRSLLERYYAKFQPFNQGTLLLAERKLDFELPNCPVGFTTRIDRLMKLAEGEAEICDYKTSKTLPAGPKDDAFRLQMATYQLAVQQAFPQFEKITLTQYYLRHQEAVRYQMRPDEIDELAEQFRGEAHEIVRAERLENWTTREAGHCRFCDYAPLCPAKRHERAMADSEESEAPAGFRDAATLADKFLHCHTQIKLLGGELDALKEELTEAARQLKVSKFQGSTGQVTVYLKQQEKLPTKTKDPKDYFQMVSLVRSWDPEVRETCMKPDETVIMSLFHKNRLTADQKAALGKLVRTTESAVIRGKLDQPADPEAADGDQEEG